MLTKNRIIAILTAFILVLIYLHFDKEEVIKIVTKTTTKYDTITKVIDNTKPTKITKVYIKVTDTIKENDTITKVIYKDLKVNEYVYKDSLENGVLDAKIIADKIYKRDIKLTTYNKETDTETIKTIVKSNLFIGVNTALKFDNTIDNTSINAYYVRKDKWLVNGGIGMSFDNNKPIVNIGIALKF